MKNISLKVLSTLTFLSLLTGCGGDSSSSGRGLGSSDGTTPGAQAQEEVPMVDGSHIQGHYQADFVTLNSHVNGTIPGSANFFRKEEKIYAYIRLFAGRPKAWHQQFVYTGSRCPTMSDDTNGDGFIDIQEAEAVAGKILIPMDSDISSQASGRRFFPLGDLSGYYHYERITNFSRFLSDLQSADSDPADDMVKLAADEPLVLTGKVFMVYGVDEATDFPDTVASKGRFRVFQTLPIACGTFQRMDTAQPGVAYNPEDIGPVGEVIEGQDRPADDLPTDTTGGSTSGNGTGTNDSDDGNGPVSDEDGNTSGGSSTGGTTGGTTTGGSTGGTTGTETTGGETSGDTTNDTDSSGETTGGF